MIGWILFIGWFVLGVWFAPRAAALAYRYSGMSYEDNKISDAKAVFVISVLIGPVIMAWYAFRIFAWGSMKEIHGSRFEKALIRHDPGYRAKHLDKQERRIKQLERDNERLTREVLGK